MAEDRLIGLPEVRRAGLPEPAGYLSENPRQTASSRDSTISGAVRYAGGCRKSWSGWTDYHRQPEGGRHKRKCPGWARPGQVFRSAKGRFASRTQGIFDFRGFCPGVRFFSASVVSMTPAARERLAAFTVWHGTEAHTQPEPDHRESPSGASKSSGGQLRSHSRQVARRSSLIPACSPGYD